ncbi:MAG: hypothetical protein VB861_02020, partial [Planctomycetaceae bacterium]
IELPKTTKINRVVLSRDRGGKLRDRTPTAFDILISNDGKAWKTANTLNMVEHAAWTQVAITVLASDVSILLY